MSRLYRGFSVDERARVSTMRTEGKTWAQIAEQLGVTENRLYAYFYARARRGKTGQPQIAHRKKSVTAAKRKPARDRVTERFQLILVVEGTQEQLREIQRAAIQPGISRTVTNFKRLARA